MGKEATVVVKRLAGDVAMKRNENYSQVVCWMRCSLAFSLARSAIYVVFGALVLPVEETFAIMPKLNLSVDLLLKLWWTVFGRVGPILAIKTSPGGPFLLPKLVPPPDQF